MSRLVDRRFWRAELARAGHAATRPFARTMLVVLVDYHHLPKACRAHRAMADAEMAASLLGQIQHDLRTRHRVARADHALLMARHALAAVA